jgi:hypothetical protein
MWKMNQDRPNDNLEQILECCLRECAEALKSADDAMGRSCRAIYGTYHHAKAEGRLRDLGEMVGVRKKSLGDPAATLRAVAREALGKDRPQLAHTYGDALCLADEAAISPDDIIEFIHARTLTGAAKEYKETHRNMQSMSVQVDLALIRNKLREIGRKLDWTGANSSQRLSFVIRVTPDFSTKKLVADDMRPALSGDYRLREVRIGNKILTTIGKVSLKRKDKKKVKLRDKVVDRKAEQRRH